MDEQQVEIRLFDPGMGPLHRAGLGGLAASLVTLGEVPAGSWELRHDRVVLRSGDWPRFLSELYSRAFGLRDGLVDMPGAWGRLVPELPVRAALQEGLLYSLWQYRRKSRNLPGGPATVSYEVDETPVRVSYSPIAGYPQQRAWEGLVAATGRLREVVELDSTLAPGFASRHARFDRETGVALGTAPALALHFLPVGALALRLRGRQGDPSRAVLLVPDCEDLEDFARKRPLLNPRSHRECLVSSPADAALQAVLRLRAGRAERVLAHRVLAVLFEDRPWGRQKTPKRVLEVLPESIDLGRFERACAVLPPRVRLDSKGAGYWVDSVVRPLIAENLAAGRAWYEGFRGLFFGAGGQRESGWRLNQERRGVHEMVSPDNLGVKELALIRAVHEAMRRRFGQLWEESGHNTELFRSRRQRQEERWRLAFCKAKTPEEFWRTRDDLFARAGQLPALQELGPEVLASLVSEDAWERDRSLILLALVSYKPRSGDAARAEEPDVEDVEETVA
jgi:CRISPR-associated protein Cas8a1/Csx13